MEKAVQWGIISKETYARIQRTLQRPFVRALNTTLLLFLTYMFFYLSLLGEMIFVDEVEIFQNGYLMSRGMMLYKNILSQHMPFSYYLGMVVSWFSPNNSHGYRLGFYVIMTILFIAMYFRHRKYTPPVALIFTPVFFFLVLPYHSLASSMLSDHWQGIGIGILLLEFLRYIQTKDITFSTAVWISLGIQLSFGSAFLAAYAILPVMLAVIAIQIYDYRHTAKEERPALLKRLTRQDIMLTGIVLLPMAVLMLYYLINGNLGNFIKGAYLVNTQVYSKYIGGFGSNPISAAIAPIKSFCHLCKDALFAIRADPFDPLHVVTLLMLIGNIVIPIWLVLKKHYAAGIAWFFSSVMCGVRGFTGFHSMPYFFVSALSVGLIFAFCMERMFEKKKYVLGIIAIGLLAIAANKLPSELHQAGNVIGVIPISNGRKEVIDTILEKDDPIHITDVTQMSYVFDYKRTVDYGGAISTPWTYEAYGQEELDSIRTVKPKVVFYSPGGETWGYKHDEYGKDLVQYITANYTLLDESDMWVRNDLYVDAKKKLGLDGKNLYLVDGEPFQYINIEENGVCIEYVVPDRDLDLMGVGLYTGNYLYGAKGTIGLGIRNEETGETVCQTAVDTSKFKDISYNRVNTPPFSLKGGVKYSISIRMEDSEAGTLAMALFEDTDQSADPIEAYSNYEDGEKWDFGVYLVENPDEDEGGKKANGPEETEN